MMMNEWMSEGGGTQIQDLDPQILVSITNEHLREWLNSRLVHRGKFPNAFYVGVVD